MLRPDGKRFDQILCRGAYLCGCPQPRLAEDGSDFRLCLGIARDLGGAFNRANSLLYAR